MQFSMLRGEVITFQSLLTKGREVAEKVTCIFGVNVRVPQRVQKAELLCWFMHVTLMR